jgi:hypothetical protein
MTRLCQWRRSVHLLVAGCARNACNLLAVNPISSHTKPMMISGILSRLRSPRAVRLGEQSTYVLEIIEESQG